MALRVIVGAQWGDEGKGKIVDVLSERADVIARHQGGPNAGHTVVVNGRTHILHLIPSGVLRPNKVCVVGNGVVLAPQTFFSELDQLRQGGISVDGRLFVSERAHLRRVRSTERGEWRRQIDDYTSQLRTLRAEFERLRKREAEALTAITETGRGIFGDGSWREAKAEWWQKCLRFIEAAEAVGEEE